MAAGASGSTSSSMDAAWKLASSLAAASVADIAPALQACDRVCQPLHCIWNNLWVKTCRSLGIALIYREAQPTTQNNTG